MARLIVFEDVLLKRNAIRSERVRSNVDNMLRTIEEMPGVGSALVPKGIRLRFGDGIRKAVVSPFELIYEYDSEANTVYVYNLLPCKATR